MSPSPDRPRRLCIARFIGAATALLACAHNAAADQVEQFYKGRQIKLVVGGEAGSEYDTWARLIARHMGRHIPGRPQFLVQNMPGAGQIIATNLLFNIADRDGSIIGMVSRNLPYLAVTGAPTLRIDVGKFHWLGSPERAHRVCLASDRSAVKTADDLLQTELLVGGTGAGSGTTAVPTLLARLLGLKLKVVEGYRGAPAVMLAIERGELEGICFSIEALRSSKPEWLKTGKVRVLFNLEPDPLPGGHIPSVFKFTTSDRQRRILDVLNAGSDFGRPMVAPPGVPAQRVAALRQALADMAVDVEAIADAAKAGNEVGLITGEQLADRLKKLLATPTDIVAETERLSR